MCALWVSSNKCFRSLDEKAGSAVEAVLLDVAVNLGKESFRDGYVHSLCSRVQLV